METKYEEALKRAKKLKDGFEGYNANVAIIEEIFPELADSEDERIRKAIMGLTYIDGIEPILTKCSITAQDIRKYLEKQKAKERLDRMAPIYNDKESFESALEKAWKYYNESASRTVDSFEDDYIECVFSKGFREGFLYKEKQKEQKPELCDMGRWDEESYNNGIHHVLQYPEAYGLTKQKSLECLKAERDGWYVCIKDYYRGGKKQCSIGDLVQAKGGMYMMGEEDISEWFRRAYYEEVRDAFEPNVDTNIPEKPAEKQDYSGLTDLERAIHRGFLAAGVENVPVTIIKETAKECKQMKSMWWSEEDEKMMKLVNHFLEMYRKITHYPGNSEEGIDKVEVWLKSLRPKPQLKLIDKNIEKK